MEPISQRVPNPITLSRVESIIPLAFPLHLLFILLVFYQVLCAPQISWCRLFYHVRDFRSEYGLFTLYGPLGLANIHLVDYDNLSPLAAPHIVRPAPMMVAKRDKDDLTCCLSYQLASSPLLILVESALRSLHCAVSLLQARSPKTKSHIDATAATFIVCTTAAISFTFQYIYHIVPYRIIPYHHITSHHIFLKVCKIYDLIQTIRAS